MSQNWQQLFTRKDSAQTHLCALCGRQGRCTNSIVIFERPISNWVVSRQNDAYCFWTRRKTSNALASAIYTRKVARQYDICWLKKELSMVHGTLHILLLFCLSRQKAEIFSICLIDDFEKTCKISAHSDKHFFTGYRSCKNVLECCEFSQN